MEFEVEPCLELKYCAVCWWYVKAKRRRRHLNHADVLLNGVPVCEEHLPELLKDIYYVGAVICDFFENRREELEEELRREIKCEGTGQWNLCARLKVTMKEQSEER